VGSLGLHADKTEAHTTVCFSTRESSLDRGEFADLMRELAAAWAATDAERAAACFADDAIYMAPPDRQLFEGREQLAAYFSPLRPGTYLALQHIWFDEATGVGAAEFSFGVEGRETANHGVAVVAVRDGRISVWREYHRKGPADFDEFIATEPKDWMWHIGNYP
jgi:uncharacterized protein (TIGR02246 family)